MNNKGECMKSSTMLKIGEFVQAKVPKKHEADRTTYGRVAAIEIYTDDNGTRQWVYVNWYADSGKPLPEAQKHVAAELEVIDEAE